MTKQGEQADDEREFKESTGFQQIHNEKAS